MAVLLVTYALNNPSRDYSSLKNAIQTTANGWSHHIDNVWIVNTDLSASDFAHKLLPHILKNDRLLVVKITAEHQGWLPAEAWKWMNERQY